MRILSIIILILISGCSTTFNLNKELYNKQRIALKESPYKDSPRVYQEISVQREFRKKIAPEKIRELLFSKNDKDTIILMESYDNICLGCSSFRFQILMGDSIYNVERKLTDSNNKVTYEVKPIELIPHSTDFNYQLQYGEVLEIHKKVKNGVDWTANPLNYGWNECADGDHTLISVVYPNDLIETMYVRCWDPEVYRNKPNHK